MGRTAGKGRDTVRVKKAVAKRKAVQKKTSSAKKEVKKQPARKKDASAKRKALLPARAPLQAQSAVVQSEIEPLFLRSTAASPIGPEILPVGTAELPATYGDNLIYLMVRDPHWLFTYWEIQRNYEETVLAQLGGRWDEVRRILRLYDTTGSREEPAYMDISLEVMTDRWYLHVQPNHSYFVEIGLLHRDGRYLSLARSNEVVTPRASISDVIDEQWAGSFEEIFALSGGLKIGDNRSSIDFRRRLEEQILSGISSGSGAGLLSSMASPVRKGQAQERKFWFVLDCEVIVYGATEPDAKVTFQGRPVKLRPDGTFSFRFALPDGIFRFEAKAESADGIEERTITPTVERVTERPAPVFKVPESLDIGPSR